jgi:hypothetical protein
LLLAAANVDPNRVDEDADAVGMLPNWGAIEQKWIKVQFWMALLMSTNLSPKGANLEYLWKWTP